MPLPIDNNLLENIVVNHGNILLLLTILCLNFLLARVSNIQPLNFFVFYCQLLANKVNKLHNSHNQQKIAGFVAILITVPVIITILALFEMFIEVNWLWQGFLLFIALGNIGLSTQGKKIAQALVAKNNYQAKQMIQPLVLRECSQLSSMGLSKAFIEMHVIRHSQQLVTTSAIFLLFGPLVAFAYRLLLEMHYCWNIKCERFVYFGRSVNVLVNFLQWLPTRFFGVLLLFTSFNQHWLLFWRLSRQSFFKLNHDFLIHSFALINEIKLGGVAIYQGKKLRRTSFNDQAKQPEPSDIIHSSYRLRKTLIILLIITVFFNVFYGLL
jgi:adenosylcobinamide-phosphate synthase